jgi:hypothetical protein
MVAATNSWQPAQTNWWNWLPIFPASFYRCHTNSAHSKVLVWCSRRTFQRSSAEDQIHAEKGK